MSFKNKIKNIFALDDEYEYYEEEKQEQEEKGYYQQEPAHQETKKQNVVSLKSMQQSSKVVLCEPRTYNEAQEIADHLVNRRAVVINLQRVDNQAAKRVVDFLSGTVYAINGDIQKLGDKTFLCTPDNVDVSGTITEVINESEQGDFRQRW
ncbi:cell division protein SepF [Pontibacillus litoralis]|uniref:Cell division protein SepF n=1 Tax=Pontibacillus litoralis JSM 072002 TaxID=1385512 RepID=A0A0A5GBR3_9BACI|nr:cell division protein SepF [Pontibacillus litoralis]KGX88525.1 cell division protein SepF [Pontibacillus litoralis JSM 072002]